MQRNKLTRMFAATAAIAVLAAACGDTTDPGTEGSETPVENAAPLSTYVTEPEHLVPQNSNESEGSAVLSALFKGLVDYDAETTEAFNQVAEDISTDDNQTYTVKVADGWTFHNGEKVTAASFVDAWNFAADSDNAMQTRSFFAPIMGFVADGEGDTAHDTLEGLKIVDEMTFTIELKAADPSFPIQLGYTSFYPLPSVAFDDVAAFEEAPIGNGPFMMDGSWQHDVEIKTVKFDGYGGSEAAQISGLTFKIYADQQTAYNDLLAGNLDIMDSLPSESIDEARERFGDKFGESPSSSINYLGLPVYVEWLAGDENKDLRRALSMAIDQETLVSGPIFNGNRKAAFSMINPVIPGYRASVCDNWSYNPTEAKALWDAAGGYDGKIEMWFNSGAGHDDWVSFVQNQWVENLGVSADQFEFQTLQFADYLPVIDSGSLTGPFRLGWGMDYPHPQNYTEPMFASYNKAPNGSNASFFDNADFDAKVAEGNNATSLETAIPFFQQAEDILCEELPVIPMFFGLNQYASSDNVDGLYVTAFSQINYTGISRTS